MGHVLATAGTTALPGQLLPQWCLLVTYLPSHFLLPHGVDAGPPRGAPNLSLIPQWVHLSSASDSSQPLLTFSVTSPLSSWGRFSPPPIKMIVVALSALPGTGWDPSSLDSEAGSPWQCKQETFLPGPPTESLPINLLYLDCLTKLLAGTSLQTVTTQEPLAPKLVGT